jgi:membrane-associated protease RseP (regulator of RpoE activity)
MIQNAHIKYFVCAAAVFALALNVSGAAKGPRFEKKVAYLGVIVSGVGETVRSQLNLTSGGGLAIQQVMDGSPAEKAGLRKHDIIEKCGDQVLFNGEQFTALVRSHKPGDQVTLEILREGKPQSVNVTLGEQELPKAAPMESQGGVNPYRRLPPWYPFLQEPYPPMVPHPFFPLPGAPRPMKRAAGFLGVELRPVDASLAAQLGLEEGTGALVGHVLDDSPAQKAHLKEYDIILKLNGKTVKGPGDLSERIRAGKKGEKVRLQILRQGKTKELEATLGATKPDELDWSQPLLRQYRYVPKIEVKPLPGWPGQSVIRFRGVEGQDASADPLTARPSARADSPRDARTLKRAVIMVNSDEGTITVREDNENRHVTVRSPDGKIVFEGPVTNQTQRAQLPPDVRRQLDRIGSEIKAPGGQNIREMRVWNPPLPPI